ncbi:MAG TPA: DUF367 domain-containing protein [Candidatus Polarisedimenticolaceae bacterium]|nr:DUF367 domain-containing protein [Candidatus Polarisedimenticolaceae bacterium]
MDILIAHDRREPRNKCSVTPLRGMAGVRFVPLHPARRLDAGRRIWLAIDGDELTADDRGLDLLLIDSTWRRIGALSRRIDGDLLRRRLPRLVTAFPRRSKLVPDPEGGLASVEALYAATVILGSLRPELLAHYRWREQFLAANRGLLG